MLRVITSRTDPPQRRRVVPTVCFLLLVLVWVSLATRAGVGQLLPKKVPNPPAASSAPAAPEAPPPEADQPIPLPQIADKAEELDRLVREIRSQLGESPELVAADTGIKSEAPAVRDRARQLESFLANAPSPLEVQEEDRYWRSLNERYTSYRKLTTTRAARLEEQVALLGGKERQWQATLAQIKDNKGIEAVVDRVNLALREIRECHGETKADLNRVVNLQTQVSQQEQQITDALRRLSEAREQLRGRLFERDAPPLWKIGDLGFVDDSLSAIAHRSTDRGFMAADEFLRQRWLRLVLIVALYGIALLLALKFKRDIGQERFVQVPVEAERVFTRPYSVALLVALLGTMGQSMAAPAGLVFLIYLLYSLQMVRLTPLLTDRRVLPLLYALAAFSLIVGLYLFVQVSPLLRRELLTGIDLAAWLTFAWLTRGSVVRTWDTSNRKLRLSLAGVRVSLGLLAASVLANVLGYVSLSQVIGVATLLGIFAAVLLYGLVRVLKLMLTLGLETWGFPLGDGRKSVEYWGGIALTLAGVVLWLDTASYLFGVHVKVAAAAARALAYSIPFAKYQLNVGDVLNAVLVLIAGYAVANLVTFFFRESVLSKLRLSRGLPLAISTIAYYLMLVLVFFVAVAELGVELNKLTLFTGALGVGVGFGLQTTISNFVSGLILLFERPIRVGDVVDLGGIVGSVRRIGVRSSTIHTFDDAEVIVPNNDLISNKVTNWTLSSPRRRVDVPVGVAYGTEPGPVLNLLVGVAEANPGVLRQPKPVAFFIGFGESALNFEVRFWATQETWFQLKSDVSVGIATALGDAGIEIPFPQRDLHLRSIDANVRSAIASAAETAALIPAGGTRVK